MVRDQPHGLAVFDLDGALLRGPTVCEVLAGPLGHLERMPQFEALFHASALDIAAAREEMAGWYRAVPLADLTALLETATVAPGAAEAITMLQQHGSAVAIAPITWEFAVAWLARRLGADHYVGTRLAVDGTVSHFWPHGKATWARTLGERLQVPLHRIAGIGDSAGDAEMPRAVGTPMFVGQTCRLPCKGSHTSQTPICGRLRIGSSQDGGRVCGRCCKTAARPAGWVHGDCHGRRVVFVGDELRGLFDFARRRTASPQTASAGGERGACLMSYSMLQ